MTEDHGVPQPVEPLHLRSEEMSEKQCQWAYGDGPFTFCGHPRAGRFRYCAYHLMLTTSRRA